MDRCEYKDYESWRKLNIFAVVALFSFFTVYLAVPNYCGSIYSVYYPVAVVVLVSFYFYFRRLSDGIELKLWVLFCLWQMVVNVLHGDVSHNDHYAQVINLWSCCLYLSVATLVSKNKRMRLLDLVATIFCIYTTILGLAVLYSLLFAVKLINPFTSELLGCLIGGRLYIYGFNPNIVGNWFFWGMSFSVYLFLRSRKISLRVITAIAAYINFCVITYTQSRSSMLGIALGAGMLAVLVFYKIVKPNKVIYKAVALLCVMAVIVPLAYKSFDVNHNLLNNSVEKVAEIKVSKRIKAEEHLGQTLGYNISENVLYNSAAGTSATGRNVSLFADTGRLPIYKSAIKAIFEEPEILIIGREDTMAATSAQLKLAGYKSTFVHHHNLFLEITMHSGVGALVIMLAFIFSLAFKMIKLYFTENSGVDLAVKSLTIPLTGFLIYNMLEISMVSFHDLRSVSFFTVAGFVIASYNDFCKE